MADLYLVPFGTGPIVHRCTILVQSCNHGSRICLPYTANTLGGTLLPTLPMSAGPSAHGSEVVQSPATSTVSERPGVPRACLLADIWQKLVMAHMLGRVYNVSRPFAAHSHGQMGFARSTTHAGNETLQAQVPDLAALCGLGCPRVAACPRVRPGDCWQSALAHCRIADGCTSPDLGL